MTDPTRTPLFGFWMLILLFVCGLFAFFGYEAMPASQPPEVYELFGPASTRRQSWNTPHQWQMRT